MPRPTALANMNEASVQFLFSSGIHIWGTNHKISFGHAKYNVYRVCTCYHCYCTWNFDKIIGDFRHPSILMNLHRPTRSKIAIFSTTRSVELSNLVPNESKNIHLPDASKYLWQYVPNRSPQAKMCAYPIHQRSRVIPSPQPGVHL